MPTWQKDTGHVDGTIFRHHVSIEQNQPTTGSRGESLPNWTTVLAGVPAAIEPLSGRQLELARQMVTNATHKITTRYHPNIEAVNYRILWNDHTFTIGLVIDPDFRHRQLVMTCYEENSP
jgi:SPP1 family predicted phage head-tail adaptor